MAPTPLTPIRQSQLLNRLVIDYYTTEEVGRVDQILVDSKTHQVEGIVCKSGLLGRYKHAFDWMQIETIGQDSILVKQQGAPQSDKLETAQAMIGHEIWADSGERIGRLVDYCIHPTTGAVLTYLFTAAGLRGMAEGLYCLLPSAVISTGRKRIMAEKNALETAEQFSEGLNQKAANAFEFIKSDYAKTQQDLTSAVGGAQAIAEQWQTQRQKLSSQAKDKLADVASQFKQQSRRVGDQVQDTLFDLTTQFQSKSSSESGLTDREQDANHEIDLSPLEDWPDDDRSK
ncbi:MAG: PRC-barrel domain-containing protein [Leptolyngbyaceae cyanobacterium MO_188.B28]|nr:PRC-barrel domain-containing protein [Leptolyngbyaceae cyanobacterium MO_188.B28]